MELRQLRQPRQLFYFVALAEELHFQRAAEREHIAQPAFSEQIRRLERELGVRLFDRTSPYVRLTGAGRLFLDEVRQALTQVKRVAERAGRGELGHVVVGFIGSAANELTPLILRAFPARYPNVGVELREFDLAGLQRYLARWLPTTPRPARAAKTQRRFRQSKAPTSTGDFTPPPQHLP